MVRRHYIYAFLLPSQLFANPYLASEGLILLVDAIPADQKRAGRRRGEKHGMTTHSWVAASKKKPDGAIFSRPHSPGLSCLLF